MGHMPKAEVEEVMELRVTPLQWKGQDFRAMEDGADNETDVGEKALLQQQASVARTAEKEKLKGVAEARSRAELRVRRMTDKISLRAEAELDLWVDPHAAEEKETDDHIR